MTLVASGSGKQYWLPYLSQVSAVAKRRKPKFFCVKAESLMLSWMSWSTVFTIYAEKNKLFIICETNFLHPVVYMHKKRTVLLLYLLSSVVFSCTSSPTDEPISVIQDSGLDNWGDYLPPGESIAVDQVESDSYANTVQTVWQGQQLTHTIDGRYQIQIPEEWVVADLHDPTLYSVALAGAEELTSYLGNEQAALLLGETDIAGQANNGIQLIAYLEQDLWQSPPTVMNVFVGELDPRGLDTLVSEYAERLHERIGDEFVFTRALSKPAGKEIAYSYYLKEEEVELGFLMFFFAQDEELVLITFVGIPHTLSELHNSLEVIPFSLVQLGSGNVPGP